MANEVPGVRVPDALLERMRRADGAGGRGGRGHRDCAGDRRRAARALVQGVQVSTPVGRHRGGAGSPRWTSLTVQRYSRSVRSAGTQLERFQLVSRFEQRC